MNGRWIACFVALVAVAAHGAAPDGAQPSEALEARVKALLEAASSYMEEDHAKREAAKAELVEVGAPAVPYLVSRLDSTDVMERIALNDVLPKIGEPAVDELHAAFRNPTSARQHRRVMALIGTIGSERSGPVLTEAADDDDWAIRAAAAEGLGRLAERDTGARAVLYGLLEDEDWSVRLRATWALADAGLGSDVNTVAERLDDAHFSVRLAAAEVLGKQGQAAVGAIARRLEASRPTPLRKLVCLDALGRTAHPAAAVYIERFLVDPDPLVRTRAAQAYGNTAPATAAALCAALLEQEQDPNVRQALLEARTAIEGRKAH